MVSRRTIGLDASMVSELRSIALRRGMNLVSYLRRLVSEAIELERRGYYAPRALSEKRVEYLLSSFNFVYVPMELINSSLSDEAMKNAREFGTRLGMTLRELGVNAYELVEFLGTSSGILIYEGDKVVVTPASGGKGLIAELVKGLALGSGLECNEGRGVFVIKVPEEVVKRASRALEEGLASRRGRRSK